MKEPPTLEDIRKQTELRTLCTKCFVKSENNWLRQEIIRLKKQPLTQTGELHRAWDKEMVEKLRETQSQLSKLKNTSTAELMVENDKLKNKISDMEFNHNQQINKINSELTKCKELIINSKFSNLSSEQKEALLKLSVTELVSLEPQIKEEETKEEPKEEPEETTQSKVLDVIKKENDVTQSELLLSLVDEGIKISQPRLSQILDRLTQKKLIKKYGTTYSIV